MRADRLSIISFFLFAVLACNLFRMQVLRGPYYESLSDRNRIRVVYLEAPRGRILDRNGDVLATSRLSFNCTAVSSEAKAHLPESCRILAPILRTDPDRLEKEFAKKKPGFFNTVLVAEDISREQAMAIEEKLDLLPGFMIETRPQREYPLASSAAHVVGYIGPVTDAEMDTLEFHGYRPVDWIGREGVESYYESYLRGRSGGLQMEVDSRGRFLEVLGVKEPREGKDIRLTIDAGLQKYVEELLKNDKGSIIVMELGEGGLLSLNSSPSFDPNLFASRRGRRDVGKYFQDRKTPLINRGIRGQYPAGSIFKIVTAMAAMAEKKISAVTSFHCPGFYRIGGATFRCWRESGHGTLNLAQGFAFSCNVYFYTTGLLAGVDAVAREAMLFGYSKITGVDLPGEKTGLVPTRDWKKKHFHEAWYPGETANLAIGQGYLQVTPIQALIMISTVATEGQVFRPHVVDRIEDVRTGPRFARVLDAPAEQWRAVQEGLDRVVNSDTGTGRLARVPGLRVLGKTGTAQSGQDRTHAWFVGYAPAKNPRVAVVVFLEHGGWGGVAAAKAARSVFEWLMDAGYFSEEAADAQKNSSS